jgi:8-oxo-dGTP pyrophosphatase MutT (NUDIX family)
VLERLTRHCSPTRARALAMAAIRETYEETGLLLGESAGQTLRTRSPHWRPFVDRGVTPTLDTLHFIARAITPPYRRKRFDARFFMADADLVHGEVHARPAGSGELLELHWVTPEEAQALELPNITRMVIDEVARRLREGHGPGDEGPFVRFARGKPVVERV